MIEGMSPEVDNTQISYLKEVEVVYHEMLQTS
jgi:hypothetical protein